MKNNKSWSKPEEISNLIGIKKVDWSIFEGGSTIPSDFHEDFDIVNGFHLNRGDRYKIYIIYQDKTYEAQLVNVNRKNIKSDTYQIRYNSNEELKKLFRNSFEHSYKYLKTERFKKNIEGNKKVYVVVPDNNAEYIEFYSVGKPFEYEIKLVSKTYIQGETDDNTYQKEIGELMAFNVGISIEDVPVSRPLKSDMTNSKTYKRNPQKGRNAILTANYLCEINANHKDFTSKVTGRNYVEAHHLVPMGFQDSFGVSIDIEANIVSLCVGCHKRLHHAIAEEKKEALNALYNQRASRLRKCGIEITKEILFSYYE
ncbi:HNH endonuclease [Priestia megaterium]|uniref:HNH endonuclease n=1 Tax=Priestia megaterium TaxID=1404 RepID=UPI003457DE26